MTRIKDLLEAGRTLSFEFFPPKNDEMERQLEKAVGEIAELQPSFVSVTYGALGSSRERTRDAVTRINTEQAFPAMPHLTCVGHTRADIAELLDQYAAAGIENILALGGDPPADGSDPGGEYEHASELVAQVREHPGAFSVGVAAHPELHPRSPDRESDRHHLAAKLAEADFAITQFFFTVGRLPAHGRRARRARLRQAGAARCDADRQRRRVRRMAGMNGSAVPDAAARTAAGGRGPGGGGPQDRRRDGHRGLRSALLAEDAPGLHLYALNRSESVREIYTNLGLG